MMLQLCPVPSIKDLLICSTSDLKIIAPLLDLQTFCDLIEALGNNNERSREIYYPFFDILNINQTFEGKFQTTTIFGVIQFSEDILERFELRHGLNIFTDSLWGVPSNINHIQKLPNTSFSLYCSINRHESFKGKHEIFCWFDEIYFEIGQLSNHSVSFSELLELTKHAKKLNISITNFPNDIPVYCAEQLLGWDRDIPLEAFYLNGVPENINLEALCQFVKYKCVALPENIVIEFCVHDYNSFKNRLNAFKNVNSKDYFEFVIKINGNSY